MNRSRSAAALLATCLFAAPAAGQSAAERAAERAAARQLGREANSALRGHDSPKALDLYTRAEELNRTPAMRLGRARALVNMGKLVAAYELYSNILREGPGRKSSFWSRKAIESAVLERARLERRLANIVVKLEGASSAEITLDGEPLSETDVGTKKTVDPGPHVARARAEGYAQAEVAFKLADGATETITLRLEPNVETPLPPPEASPPPKPPSPAPPSPALPPPRRVVKASGPSTQATIGYLALGVGGVALAAGGVTGVLAWNARSTLDDSCNDKDRCPTSEQSTLDSYRRFGAVSTIASIGGLAGVTTGAVLLLTAPKDKRGGASARLWVGPSGLGLSGRF
jgi:hypothetical protein